MACIKECRWLDGAVTVAQHDGDLSVTVVYAKTVIYYHQIWLAVSIQISYRHVIGGQCSGAKDLGLLEEWSGTKNGRID
jgi:hypothetical protein